MTQRYDWIDLEKMSSADQKTVISGSAPWWFRLTNRVDHILERYDMSVDGILQKINFLRLISTLSVVVIIGWVISLSYIHVSDQSHLLVSKEPNNTLTEKRVDNETPKDLISATLSANALCCYSPERYVLRSGDLIVGYAMTGHSNIEDSILLNPITRRQLDQPCRAELKFVENQLFIATLDDHNQASPIPFIKPSTGSYFTFTHSSDGDILPIKVKLEWDNLHNRWLVSQISKDQLVVGAPIIDQTGCIVGIMTEEECWSSQYTVIPSTTLIELVDGYGEMYSNDVSTYYSYSQSHVAEDVINTAVIIVIFLIFLGIFFGLPN